MSSRSWDGSELLRRRALSTRQPWPVGWMRSLARTLSGEFRIGLVQQLPDRSDEKVRGADSRHLSDVMSVGIDNRWAGHHGIARYAREVIPRLEGSTRDLLLAGSPTSALGVVTFSRARSISATYSPGSPGEDQRASHLFTVHDLIHLESVGTDRLRYRAYYELMVKPAIRGAGVVLTVSETSRLALVEWLADETIDVVNAGNGVVQHFVPDETDRFGDAEPYVLYVGAVRPHKNLGVLIQALAQVPGLTLKAVGPDVDRATELAFRAGVSARVSGGFRPP